MDIVIPNLAESVTEGDLAAWLKQDGERVEKDDLILELETDKASVELAAEASGTLEILVQAGQTVHVGDVVGRIVEGVAERESSEAEKPGAEAKPGKKPEAPKEPEPKPEPSKPEPKPEPKPQPEEPDAKPASPSLSRGPPSRDRKPN